MKLGKLPPKFHPKTLQFAKYLTGALPTPAEKVYREYKIPDDCKQMWGNDTIGDCTCAAIANFLVLTTIHTCDRPFVPLLEDVIGMYSAVSGYDPATGANDNGANMTDVLNHMQTVGLGGHKILAWAAIDFSNRQHQELAVDYFAARYTGVRLPNTAQEQFAQGQSWELTRDTTIAGGHAILSPGYGSAGDDYVTWAKWDQKASTVWSKYYVEEDYAIITEDWFDRTSGKTPGGLDRDALYADIKLL